MLEVQPIAFALFVVVLALLVGSQFWLRAELHRLEAENHILRTQRDYWVDRANIYNKDVCDAKGITDRV
jgi:hypothetical protein